MRPASWTTGRPSDAGGRAEDRDRHRSAVVNEGMWGGFAAVDAARTFVRRYLSTSRGAARNIQVLRSRLRPHVLLVGVHVRAGDFTPAASATQYDGGWNDALPMDWYLGVCGALRKLLGDRVQFLVLGGDPGGPSGTIARELGALTTSRERYTDVSDLVLLSTSDLLVCSVSAFSLAAAWLSDSPYLWPRAQLHDENGWLSIWGAEAAQSTGLTKTNRLSLAGAAELPPARGMPIGWDGSLPASLEQALSAPRGAWDKRSDLIYYGVVRDPEMG